MLSICYTKKIHQHFNLKAPFLSIYPREVKTYVQEKKNEKDLKNVYSSFRTIAKTKLISIAHETFS